MKLIQYAQQNVNVQEAYSNVVMQLPFSCMQLTK